MWWELLNLSLILVRFRRNPDKFADKDPVSSVVAITIYPCSRCEGMNTFRLKIIRASRSFSGLTNQYCTVDQHFSRKLLTQRGKSWAVFSQKVKISTFSSWIDQEKSHRGRWKYRYHSKNGLIQDASGEMERSAVVKFRWHTWRWETWRGQEIW